MPSSTATPSAEMLQQMAHAIRFLSVDAILKAGEGHQGVPLGMAELATALFAGELKFLAADPTWPDRDRFVLSNGHGSMLLYALLHLSGYAKIGLDQVKSFRELDSHCAGHPEYDPAAGIEATTGPLGQGIANALGMAIAEAYLNARFGDGIVDHMTWAFVGDGCLQEGVGQEAIALAGHLGLGKLAFVWDDNRITDDGSTELSISENVADRFRVAGWHVVEIDGHDLRAAAGAFAAARTDPRPTLIAARTTIARGIPRLQGQRGGHSAKLYETDRADMAALFDWAATPFEIPDTITEAWRAAGRRNAQCHAAWKARLEALSSEDRAVFERTMAGDLPAGWCQTILAAKQAALADPSPRFSIQASGDIVSALYDEVPEIFVACADLEAPTNHKRHLAAFARADRAGRYLHCGVREHVMASLANGMAAHGGIRPAAVTYLAFSDYERPAMRMAALMGLPVVFVFSHDSIGIGKNGPTHQPVEILAALRAMPNMRVIRPADAIEAAEAWEIALSRTDGPTSLIFARQQLPLLRRDATAENKSARGAYVLADATGGERRATLLATGSEVAIATEARTVLQERGIPTAVVSMPCWDLFGAEDKHYRRMVLGPSGVRIGIEAAVRFGWDQWLGPDGDLVGMSGFGASGPADALYRRFGITPEAVVSRTIKLLGEN
ncbi:transketolase family protein [Aliidongia dinghuensis]|nr:transketolase [Aliidongia dinghuensis]